jgi:UDP-GlcNAc:undecaprenyl-phosphate GlcNAc-1-phosphate transferase
MDALPLIVSALAAALVAPGLLRALGESRLALTNYRERLLPFPAGTVIVAAAALAAGPLALWLEWVSHDDFSLPLSQFAVYILGVAFLGLFDDALGGTPRGWRGHGAAALRGSISTGAIKAAGALGLALYVLSDFGFNTGEYLLAAAVLVLFTNLFNRLDLRPGRSVKGFVLLTAGLAIGKWALLPVWDLGLFIGPVLVVGLYDLRERAMLGDTGSNLVGALAGLLVISYFGTTGQAIALGVALAITIYGEFRSISAFLEKAPLLRQLDSFGRPA